MSSLFFKVTWLRRFSAACMAGLVACTAVAQDQPSASQKDQSTVTDSAEEKEQPKVDPFAVPDGTPEELLEFIGTVKRIRVRTVTELKTQVGAVITACDRILESDDPDVQLAAIKEKFGALSALSRYDAVARTDLQAFAANMANDPRPAVAKLAGAEILKSRAAGAARMSGEERAQYVEEFFAFIDLHGMDVSTYSIASTIGRTLGSVTPELGAVFYERLSAAMETAEDERIKSRAGKMLGSARRLRLPGNFMEVMGTTGDGEEFDWAAYRGKVVLVDFWASWCGPCRAEIPNMKDNLAKYGSKGFEIVGVNLDTTREKYEGYVAQEELTWTNILSDKEGEMGWDNPLANYYGITGIPTAILVDKDGKVVSLRARGSELNRLLLELLGEPESATEETSEEKPAAGE